MARGGHGLPKVLPGPATPSLCGRATPEMALGRSLVTLDTPRRCCHTFSLMVWGNFEADGNKAQSVTLLKLQMRFVGIIAGKGGHYHADPPFAQYGILKVGDHYRQQLRMHALKFQTGRLPDNQAAMLARVGETHRYGTRPARSRLVVSTGDYRLVG
jgi:hypothetical protein